MIKVNQTFSAVLVLMQVLVLSCGGGGGSGAGSGFQPSTPSGILATEGIYSGEIHISWEPVEGADYYVLEKSIDDRNNFRVIASELEGLAYIDSRVTPNRHYYYRIKAANGSLWSEPSIEAHGFAHTGKPLPPENVTASSDTIESINITWKTVPQVKSYRILRSGSPDGAYTEIAAGLPAASVEYTDSSSLSIDKVYYYRVIAVNDEGESDPGQTVLPGIALQKRPATAPSGFTATDGTYSNKVVLEWDIVPLAVTYTIYRAPDIDGDPATMDAGGYETAGVNIILDSDGNGFFEDSACEFGRYYWYTVCGVSSGGEGIKTSAISGRRAGTVFQAAAPVNITATDGEIRTITVTWDAVEGAHGYNIYRSVTADGTYVKINSADVTSTAFTDTSAELTDDLTQFRHFFYYVTALNGVESRSGIADEGYAKPAIPAVPATFTATTGRTDARINLAWTASTGAVTYNIYRADSADGPFNPLASGITALTYSDQYPAITVGRDYYYRIIARNVTGDCDPKNAAGNTVMQIPQNVSVSTTGTAYQRKVTWNTVTGATAYEIDHWDSRNPSSVETRTVTTGECIFSGLGNTRTHYFRVRAINNLPCESADSATVSSYVL